MLGKYALNFTSSSIWVFCQDTDKNHNSHLSLNFVQLWMHRTPGHKKYKNTINQTFPPDVQISSEMVSGDAFNTRVLWGMKIPLSLSHTHTHTCLAVKRRASLRFLPATIYHVDPICFVLSTCTEKRPTTQIQSEREIERERRRQGWMEMESDRRTLWTLRVRELRLSAVLLLLCPPLWCLCVCVCVCPVFPTLHPSITMQQIRYWSLHALRPPTCSSFPRSRSGTHTVYVCGARGAVGGATSSDVYGEVEPFRTDTFQEQKKTNCEHTWTKRVPKAAGRAALCSGCFDDGLREHVLILDGKCAVSCSATSTAWKPAQQWPWDTPWEKSVEPLKTKRRNNRDSLAQINQSSCSAHVARQSFHPKTSDSKSQSFLGILG